MTTCSPAGADALRLAYNANMPLLTGTTLGSTTDAYTYNSFGELASYTARHGTTTLYSEVTHSTAAPRDALGRIVEKAETVNGTTTAHRYTYVTVPRRTGIARGGSSSDPRRHAEKS